MYELPFRGGNEDGSSKIYYNNGVLKTDREVRQAKREGDGKYIIVMKVKS